jgi:hypothetical protein
MANSRLGYKFGVEGVPQTIAEMNKVGKSYDELLAKSEQNTKEFIRLRDEALAGGDQTAADKFERQRIAAAQRANDVIASSYKTLGVTSTASQDAFAKQQISAYKAIRDSGVASYEDILKAQEALNKKLQSSQVGAKFFAGSTAPNFVQNVYAKQGGDECDPCESADKIVKAIEKLGTRIDRSVNGTIAGNALKGLGNIAMSPLKLLAGGANNLFAGLGVEVSKQLGQGISKSLNNFAIPLGGVENIGKTLANAIANQALGGLAAIPDLIKSSKLPQVVKDSLINVVKEAATGLKEDLQTAKQSFVQSSGGQTAVATAGYAEQEKQSSESKEAKEFALQNATSRRRQTLRALPNVKREASKLAKMKQELQKGAEGLFKEFSSEQQQQTLKEVESRIKEIENFYAEAAKDLALIKELTPNYNLPQAYLEIAKKLSKEVGQEFKLENIPQLIVDPTFKSNDALYSPEGNQIKVSAELNERLINDEATPLDSKTIAHEYRHGYQSDFGSVQGLTNQRNNISAVDYVSPSPEQLKQKEAQINESVKYSGASDPDRKAYVQGIETDAYTFEDVGDRIHSETVKPRQLQAAKDAISESKLTSYGTGFIAEYKKIVAEAEDLGIDISKELDIVYTNFTKQFKQLDQLLTVANELDGSETSEQLINFKKQANTQLNDVADKSADSIVLLKKLVQSRKNGAVERSPVKIPLSIPNPEKELVDVVKPLNQSEAEWNAPIKGEFSNNLKAVPLTSEAVIPDKVEAPKDDIKPVVNIYKDAISKIFTDRAEEIRKAIAKGEVEEARDLFNKLAKYSDQAISDIEKAIPLGNAKQGDIKSVFTCR